ncbi:MAG: aspartate kinase [Chlamydiales bacterium]|jgi:aspartate kinase
MTTQKYIVAKFGGTSLKDAARIHSAARLVAERQSKALIVVSAMSGVTNDLLKLSEIASGNKWDLAQELLEKLCKKHRETALAIPVCQEANNKIEVILEELSSLAMGIHLLKESSKRSIDQISSIGERLSSILFTEALVKIKVDALNIDAREVIRTDDSYNCAEPQIQNIRSLTRQKIKPFLDKGTTVVTQGFIGSTENGVTTTLGRGGSDYSAALLAEALNAHSLYIWTDVPGILSCDPRKIDQCKTIEEVSFAEAAELATFGAKVLHPTTLWPAIRCDIPVFVGSSFEKECRGTWIRKTVSNLPVMRAIAIRHRQTLVTASSLKMFKACGFLANLFAILAKHKISVDLVTTSEVSVSVTLDNDSVLSKQALEDLREIANVKVEEGLALIAMVGNKLSLTAGLGKQAFDAMGSCNVRLICQGASEHNMCFLVDEEDVHQAVKQLHSQFFESNLSKLHTSESRR